MENEQETHDSLDYSLIEGEEDILYDTKGSEFNAGDENTNNSRTNLDGKKNLDRIDSNFLPDVETNGLILSEWPF